VIRIQSSVQINRSREEVFAYLTKVENLTRWQANIVEARPLDGEPLRTGSRFEQTMKLGRWKIPAVCTVTEHGASERFAFSMSSAGPVDCQARFDLHPSLGGTRLTLDGEVRLKGFWRLLRPLVVMGLRQETKSELVALKRLLEAEVPMRAG
jgi:uncharacterized protein YndB with AHSA1/START domain